MYLIGNLKEWNRILFVDLVQGQGENAVVEWWIWIGMLLVRKWELSYGEMWIILISGDDWRINISLVIILENN